MSDPFDLNSLQEPTLPFPAATKQVAGMIDGVDTDVTCINFNDKILVTISQNGRLGHWVRILAPQLLFLQANPPTAACTIREQKSGDARSPYYIRNN